MITESFLNSCFSVALNKTTKIRRNKNLYRDIIEILDFYEKEQGADIPIFLKGKFDCLRSVCEMLEQGKNPENVIDSIVVSGKNKQLLDFLYTKHTEELGDSALLDNINQVRLRRKLIFLLSNFDKLNDLVTSIKDSSFDSLDEVIQDYEEVVRSLYSNLMEQSRIVSIEASSSLDLGKDDYSDVVALIKKKYETVNVTPTGFSVLDGEVFNGGFEPSRLYVFAGGTGSGKSTLLNNFIINSATSDKVFLKSPKRVYVYVTLENTIEEALLRTYQCLFDKTLVEVLQSLSSKDPRQGAAEIRDNIVNHLNKTNSTIVMKYFPPMTVSVVDLMMALDDVVIDYGKDSIAGLFVDYLDLLRTNVKFDMYRLELGYITLALKALAVSYNIPVITATQLNRDVYRVNDARSLFLDHVSESIKKVEHADCVCLLNKDPSDDKLIHMKVGKNRSGRSNVALEFRVDFSRFKFLNGYKLERRADKDEVVATFTGFREISSF